MKQQEPAYPLYSYNPTCKLCRAYLCKCNHYEHAGPYYTKVPNQQKFVIRRFAAVSDTDKSFWVHGKHYTPLPSIHRHTPHKHTHVATHTDLNSLPAAAVTPSRHLLVCMGVTIVQLCCCGSYRSTVLKMDRPSWPPENVQRLNSQSTEILTNDTYIVQ